MSALRDQGDVVREVRREFNELLLDGLMSGVARTIRLVACVSNGWITHLRVSFEDDVDRVGAGADAATAVSAAEEIADRAFATFRVRLGFAQNPAWFGEVSAELLIADGKYKRLYVGADRQTKQMDTAVARAR